MRRVRVEDEEVKGAGGDRGELELRVSVMHACLRVCDSACKHVHMHMMCVPVK